MIVLSKNLWVADISKSPHRNLNNINEILLLYNVNYYILSICIVVEAIVAQKHMSVTVTVVGSIPIRANELLFINIFHTSSLWHQDKSPALSSVTVAKNYSAIIKKNLILP